MGKVGVTEAGRMVGYTRQTILNHIKKGKLSAEKDADGNHEIDVAELIRVYDKVSKPDDKEPEKVDVDLRVEIARLTAENEGLKARIEDKDAALSDLRSSHTHLQLALEAVKNMLPPPEPPTTVEPDKDSRPHKRQGWRSWFKSKG